MAINHHHLIQGIYSFRDRFLSILYLRAHSCIGPCTCSSHSQYNSCIIWFCIYFYFDLQNAWISIYLPFCINSSKNICIYPIVLVWKILPCRLLSKYWGCIWNMNFSLHRWVQIRFIWKGCFSSILIYLL